MAKTRTLKMIGGEQVTAACPLGPRHNLNHVENLDSSQALEPTFSTISSSFCDPLCFSRDVGLSRLCSVTLP